MVAMVVGVVVGGWWRKGTLERPGRRSHAGAWERSPSPPPGREVEGWPRQEGGSGQGGFPGKRNSPLALSRSAGCGTGKKGQAV